MGFWDIEEAKAAKTKVKRRDPSKIGIAKAVHEGMMGRMYIPPTMADPGDKIIFVETPEGLAFKIGREGRYTIRIQNGSTRILITSLPSCMNRYAPDKVANVEIEDFRGGYLIRYDQFK